MNRKRLGLALSLLEPEDWRRFEEFASVWMSSEFPELRPMASMSGDEGQDAALWQPTPSPTVVLQYSVRRDWRTKVKNTARRIREANPDATVLIYVTNQDIGVSANDLRTSIQQEFALYLDIRDRHWLLAAEATPGREQAAADLTRDVLNPYLERSGSVEAQPGALSSAEAQTACLYLSLQWEDDSRDKGLTKLSFEAVVRSVLRDTDSEHRMTRSEIYSRVRAALPAQPEDQARTYTDAALGRLEKRYIRHWKKDDEFCLTYEEATRLKERIADVRAAELALELEMGHAAERVSESLGFSLPKDDGDFKQRLRRVLERVLLERGESFAAAVRRGRFDPPTEDPIQSASVKDFNEHPASGQHKDRLVSLVAATVEETLRKPEEDVRAFLRSMADVYTVYAFLRETPDVQKTVVKLFAQGDIWLDASVLLPLFAEDLLEPSERAYTNIFRAAVEAGLRLYMTPGVLEEVNAHMRRCRAYARRTPQDPPWSGTVPFLFAAFSLTGGHRGQFAGWLETFRGESNPLDDISDYAQRAFGISLRGLEKEADQAPERLRYAVQEIFHEAQERRDRQLAAETQALLVAHDVENYVGVVELRRSGGRSATLGHRFWWLTLDSAAFRVTRELCNYLDEKAIPASPALSPDFMVTYLAIGPLRNRISKGTESSLPLATDLGALDLLPHELLDEADRIRGELSNLRPHVIDRRVRDGLDAVRQRLGPVARAGSTGMEEELKALLRAKAGVD